MYEILRQIRKQNVPLTMNHISQFFSIRRFCLYDAFYLHFASYKTIAKPFFESLNTLYPYYNEITLKYTNIDGQLFKLG